MTDNLSSRHLSGYSYDDEVGGEDIYTDHPKLSRWQKRNKTYGPVSPSEFETQKKSGKRGCMICITCTILVVIGGIAVGALLFSAQIEALVRGTDNEGAGAATAEASTTPLLTRAPIIPLPTKAPLSQINHEMVSSDVDSSTLEGLNKLISRYAPDRGESLSDQTSPQYRATKWLFSDHDYALLTDDRKLQRFALATLYYALDGPNWYNAGDWLQHPDDCNWFQVTCDDYGHVTKLMFVENGLSGTFPTELLLVNETLEYLSIEWNGKVVMKDLSFLAKFPRLAYLNLRGNKVEGTIPTEFGLLAELDTLYLSSNVMSGLLPSELGSLTYLKLLVLGENEFQGTIPSEIGQLFELTEFKVYNNHLSGPVPSEMGKLNQLKQLELDHNGFTGTMPTELGFLTNLKKLHMQKNSLTGPIPTDIGNLHSLKELYLDYNNITGNVPSELGLMTSLKSVDLSETMLKGSIPTAVCSLRKISLDLLMSDCGTDPPKIECDCCTSCLQGNDSSSTIDNSQGTDDKKNSGGNLTALLAFLSLESPDHGAALADSTTPQYEAMIWLNNDPPLDTYSENQSLQRYVLATMYFSLGGERWVDSSGWLSPTNECEWFEVTCDGDGHVTEISLAENGLSGLIPEEIVMMDQSLEYLSMERNAKVKVTDMTILAEFSKLRYLNLDDNLLNGTIPTEFGALNGLRSLYLSNNNIPGTVPSELGFLTSLEDLVLNDNELNGQLPTELGALVSLVQLKVNDNVLAGPIPSELGKLVLMNEMQLDNNGLTGTIPTELGLLLNATDLHMHNNRLAGSIPSELGLLPKLQNLYVDGNKLTGTIPTELGKVSTMNEFYAGDNQLVGQMPDEICALLALKLEAVACDCGFSPPKVKCDCCTDCVGEDGSKPLINKGDANVAVNSSNGTSTGDLPTDAPASTVDTGDERAKEQDESTATFVVDKGSILEFLSNSSPDNGKALSESDSAQYKAMSWLVSDAGFDSYSDLRKIQRYVLATIYYALGGDQWKDSERWLESSNECSWHNVGCDLKGNVEAFSAYENNLVGSLPQELVMLKDTMAYVELRGNGIDIESMAIFTDMTELQYLDLEGNYAKGSIPTDLAKLTNLAEINLNSNYLSGSIPSELGLLTRLELLSLSDNDLEGQMPVFWTDLHNLSNFSLKANLMTGTIPTEIGLFTSLLELDLSFNKLIGSLPTEIGLLTMLETLDLERNKIESYLPTEIGKMISLRKLDLTDNSFWSIPSELGMITGLNTIRLSYNDVSGAIPSELGNIEYLTELSLDQNFVNGTIPTEIGKLQNLVYCRLDINILNGPIPSEIGELSFLEYFRLTQNFITGQIPNSIGNLKVLQKLYLDANPLSGTVPTEIAKLQSLIGFNISDTNVGGSMPTEICDLLMINLEYLISDCKGDTALFDCQCCTDCL